MRSLCCIYLFLFASSSFGQTRIDDFLTVTFPHPVDRIDTTVNGSIVLLFLSDSEVDQFALQRIVIDSVENDLGKLPETTGKLIRMYDDIEEGFVESSENIGMRLKKSHGFNLNGLLGREIFLENSRNFTTVMATRILVLDQYIYILTYYDQRGIDEGKKEPFFGSMAVDMSKNPKQIREVDIDLGFYRKLGEYAFYGLALIAVLIVVLVSGRKKKTREVLE